MAQRVSGSLEREAVKRAAAFDRALDAEVNGAKADTLKQYGMPQYWLVVSHIEAQALVAGVVSTEDQAASRNAPTA